MANEEVLVDIAELLRHWPVTGPFTFDPTATGTNNRTYRVTAAEGAYILQVALNGPVPERLHRLLRLLGRAGLPFAVPAPVEARGGETMVPLADGSGRFATLAPLIPGQAPDTSRAAHLEACAVALRDLNRALATLEDPAGLVGELRIGAFSTSHPLIASPRDLIGSLDLPPGLAEALNGVYAELGEVMVSAYETLPVHIIHGDYYPSNVLVDRDRVSGIIDFETAFPAPRSVDLAIALWTFVWSRDVEFQAERAATFLRAYQGTDPLGWDELRIVPDVIMVREAQSFLHWGGRYRAGLTSLDDLHRRAHRVREVHAWVTRHRSRIENLLRMRV